MTPADAGLFSRHLAGPRVMTILRGHGPTRTLELCRRAWALGISLVEVPLQTGDDLDALTRAVELGRETGHLVGAGTITSVELVESARHTGAAFTVAPGLDADVVAASSAAGLPHLPGVATATDVHRALQLGLVWQKAFPASVLGTAWIAALRGPFPQVRFVATGGIDLDNAADFLAAGAAAVSLGSAFAAADPDRVRGLAVPGR